MEIICGIAMMLSMFMGLSTDQPLTPPDSGPAALVPLSYEDMVSSYGGDGCFGCTYQPLRVDECYHTSMLSPCGKDKCLANYLIEDTCGLGEGNCTAVKDPYEVSLVQYVRADVNCATFLPTGSILWATHFYGHDCKTVTYHLRCIKTSMCNGTLISMHESLYGIVCQ